jgi:serine/threonine-protein kinase
MGEVYEARDATTGATVALKLLLSERARGAEALARFQREAQVLATLDSTHVARVFTAGIDEASGRPFMAMELLLGEDVDRLVATLGPIDPTTALRLVAQACRGLEAAHAAGVVHRDIKPSNLFVASMNGVRIVKLLDFGIAKAHPFGEKITHTGDVMGSPAYMSPEQIADSKSVDARADIWSLGVVLYEALTGKSPHADEPNVARLLRAIEEKPAPPVQERAPWVSAEVAAVVHRAIALDPAQRYPSARAMREAIEAIVGSDLGLVDAMLTRASRTAPLLRVAPRESPSSPEAATIRSERRPPRSSRAAVIIAAGAVVVVAAGVAIVAARSRTESEARASVPAPPVAQSTAAATLPAPEPSAAEPPASTSAARPSARKTAPRPATAPTLGATPRFQ